MARRRVPGGSRGSSPPVDSVVEIRQNPDIDLKESGLALLYDPAVVTERDLRVIQTLYREAEEAYFASRPRMNPFSGEITPARGSGRARIRALGSWHDRQQFLRELAEPYVRRQALVFLDICGDEFLNVLVRLTTGPLLPTERRPQEVERRPLRVTADRLCVASSAVLQSDPEELEGLDPAGGAAMFEGPSRVEVPVPSGPYQIVAWAFTPQKRLPYLFVVQLTTAAADA
jgi:hypothetical protein